MKTVFSAYKIIKNNGYQKWILYKQQQHAPMHNASADLLKVSLKTFEKIIFILKIMAMATTPDNNPDQADDDAEDHDLAEINSEEMDPGALLDDVDDVGGDLAQEEEPIPDQNVENW